MKLQVYSVDSTLRAPQSYVGCAYDVLTAISLMHLLRAHEGKDCRVKGTLPGETGPEPIDGQFSINEVLFKLVPAVFYESSPANKFAAASLN